MAVDPLRRAVRALPPIRRRDAVVARADELRDLRAEVRTLRGALKERPQVADPKPVSQPKRAADRPVNLLKLTETPSFSRQLFGLRRGTAELRPLEPRQTAPAATDPV